MANALYYGDNLDVLRNEIASDSVDLIYLDPPFNSQANYNVLFKSPTGKAADAQIEAFEDTWHWGEQAERAFSEILASPSTQAAELLRDALVSRRKRHDGLFGDDGGPVDRTAPRPEAGRLALSALRPHRQPLPQDIARFDLPPGQLC
jgi:hypothetical protein